MAQPKQNQSFFVKDEQGTIHKVDDRKKKWEPRPYRTKKRDYELTEDMYVNGVLFLNGWYLIPFWAMPIVDETGPIEPTQPHNIEVNTYFDELEKGFEDDGITAAQLNDYRNVPVFDDLDDEDGVDDVPGSDVPVPVAAAAPSDHDGANSGD